MSQQVPQIFCNDFQQHKEKHLKFCETCADKKSDITSNLLFCAKCNTPLFQSHRGHKPFLSAS
jgi:hypothetical protein